MSKKNATKPLKTTKEMTVIAPTEEILLAQNLELRNEAVEKSYHNIIKGCKELLTAFDTLRYRMNVTIEHDKSGKETNLITEWTCYLWDITLSRDRYNYYIIHISYDEEALIRFSDKIFNRMLRIVFNNTNITATDINIENSVRIDHSATDIQIFFLNRLLSDPKDYIIVTAEERVPS